EQREANCTTAYRSACEHWSLCVPQPANVVADGTFLEHNRNFPRKLIGTILSLNYPQETSKANQRAKKKMRDFYSVNRSMVIPQQCQPAAARSLQQIVCTMAAIIILGLSLGLTATG